MSLNSCAHFQLSDETRLNHLPFPRRAARVALVAAVTAVMLVPGAPAWAQEAPPPLPPEQKQQQDEPQNQQEPQQEPQQEQPLQAPPEPVTVDDPQPRDPFDADPFAPGAAAPAMRGGESAAPDVSYDPAAETVEIHVNDADLLDVLRMLGVQSQRNIVASREVRGTVTCNLFDVTIDEALEAILRANGFVARQEGNFIFVYTQEEVRQLDEAQRRQETRVFRLYHISPRMAAATIEPSLSETAVVSVTDESASGVASSREEAGGYSYSNGDLLIIRDFPERLDEISRILEDIDTRPEQVLIEATILSTRLTENNAFGVDFNVVGGVDFTALTQNNGQITGANLGDTFENPAHSVGTGNNFTQGIGGMRVGFVSNNVSAFVAALEGVTDTTVLGNPKVLALNKQRGEVLVGSSDGYLTTTLTETAATQNVEFLDTGTRLIFRPFIGRDGYVRLEIHPEDSVGGVDARGLPFKRTTEVTTNVMVKDGHTIVIGGLFRESATINRSQIPVLGNLPIVGAAFRRQNDVTERQEIIILLTPHIVKDHERYAQLSEQELKRAEKLRVGTRKGMMRTGRERLSQVQFEKAVAEMSRSKPNYWRARMHVNSALNLNPTFIEAIELRERLTGRVVVEADQSTMRSFVRRAVMNDVREAQQPLPDDRPDRDPVLPQPRDILRIQVQQPASPANPVGEQEAASKPENLDGPALVEVWQAELPGSQPASRSDPEDGVAGIQD